MLMAIVACASVCSARRQEIWQKIPLALCFCTTEPRCSYGIIEVLLCLLAEFWWRGSAKLEDTLNTLCLASVFR